MDAVTDAPESVTSRSSPPPIFVAVVIATSDRPELLKGVCLPSVLKQTVSPDLVVVVNDSKDNMLNGLTSSAVWQHVTEFRHKGTKLQMLQNNRTPGASGAWNTGLLHVMQQQHSGSEAWRGGIDCCAHTYIAILDDDDCWEPNHLEACLTAVVKAPPSAVYHMTVSGLIRHSQPSRPQTNISPDDGRKQSLPTPGVVHPEQFYSGNPHIQGSNLFCRLDVVLAAGMFNEWLPSTTDRDLCIRLAQWGVKVAVTGVHTVHHFAGTAASLVLENEATASSSSAAVHVPVSVDNFSNTHTQPMRTGSEGAAPESISTVRMSTASRLSDPCSTTKYLGLQRFYHDLWCPLMTAEQQEAAKHRAQQLFGIGLTKYGQVPGHCNSNAVPDGASLIRMNEPPSIAWASQHVQQHVQASSWSRRPQQHVEDEGSSNNSTYIANVQDADSLCAADGERPDVPHAEQDYDPVVLLVGIVSSSGSTVRRLLSDLLQLMTQTAGGTVLGGLEVLLMENGGSNNKNNHVDTDYVAAVATHYQQLGLPIHFISRQLQLQHAAAGITAGDLADRDSASAKDKTELLLHRQLPIGVMRTLLQLHLAAVVEGLRDSLKKKVVVMILDDDKGLLRMPTDPKQVDVSFLHHLQRLKYSRAADVVLGVDAGAPPLPSASILMLGLLDVVSSLQALARLDVAPTGSKAAVEVAPAVEQAATGEPCSHPTGADMQSSGNASSSYASAATTAAAEGSLAAATAKAAAFNLAAASVWSDMYYDLSATHTSHLCVPFRTAAHYLAANKCSTAAQQSAAGDCSGRDTAISTAEPASTAAAVSCLQSIARGLQGLLHGVPFLRSIPLASSAVVNCHSDVMLPTLDLVPSVERGGCTFVLDTRALLLKQDAFPARRSDMLWCLAAQLQGFQVMKCKQLAVWHHRDTAAASASCTPSSSNFFNSVIADIKGHSLYRAVQEGLARQQPMASMYGIAAAPIAATDEHNVSEWNLHPEGKGGPSTDIKQLSGRQQLVHMQTWTWSSMQHELTAGAALPIKEAIKLARVTAFAAAFRRIQGLLKMLQDLLLDEKEYWWHEIPEVAPTVVSMQQQLQLLQSIYTTEALGGVWSTLVPSSHEPGGDFQMNEQRCEDLSSLSIVLTQMKSSYSLPNSAVAAVNGWLLQSRKMYAEYLIQRSYLHMLPTDDLVCSDTECKCDSLRAHHDDTHDQISSAEHHIPDPACFELIGDNRIQNSPGASSVDQQGSQGVHQSSKISCTAKDSIAHMAGEVSYEVSKPVISLTFLGSGHEGLVFTDHRHIYKLCLWGTALQRCPEQLQLLGALGRKQQNIPSVSDKDECGDDSAKLGQQGSAKAIKAATIAVTQKTATHPAEIGGGDVCAGPSFIMHEVLQVGPQWLLRYGPCEAGIVLAELMHDESYLALHNGYMCSGAQLLSLAKRCIAAKLICCNAHPKNMLMTRPEQPTNQHMPAADSHNENIKNRSVAAADWAAEGHLLLLDVGCDWLPPSPGNAFSLLARLYLCWRWWRRTDLSELLTRATQLMNDKLQRLNAQSAAQGAAVSRATSSSRCGDTGAAAAADSILVGLYDWYNCVKNHVAASEGVVDGSSSNSSSSSSSRSSSKKVGPATPPVPEVDVLWLTEQLPELAGFGRFAAAALGCYDAAKERMDQILLEETVKLIRELPDSSAGAVLDYGCGAKAKLLHQLQQVLPTVEGLSQPVHLVGADPVCQCTTTTTSCNKEATTGSLFQCLNPPSATTWAATTVPVAAASLNVPATGVEGHQQSVDQGSSSSSTSAVQMSLTRDCSWAAAGAGGLVAPHGYDVVICSLVLCTIADRQEYLRVLDEVAAAVKPGSGRLLLSICNPYFTMHGSTPFQQRIVPPQQQYDDVFFWRKQLLQSHYEGACQGVSRDDIHRPVDAILHDLARRGLALKWLHQTPSVNVDRPDEFNSDFLIMSLVQVLNTYDKNINPNYSPSNSTRIGDSGHTDAADLLDSQSEGLNSQQQKQQQQQKQKQQLSEQQQQIEHNPAGLSHLGGSCQHSAHLNSSTTKPVSCLIKVCAQDHQYVSQQIPYIVSRLNLPQYPLSEVVVVVDQHTEPFIRQLSAPAGTSSEWMLLQLLKELDRLQALGWVDKILKADVAGSAAVKDINSRWFGLDSCSQTHTAQGTPTTPTLQGLEVCSSDLIFQLDADLLLVARPFQQLSPEMKLARHCVTRGPAQATTSAPHSQTSRRPVEYMGPHGRYSSENSTWLQQMMSVLQTDHTAVSISLPSLPVPAATAVAGIRHDDTRQQQLYGGSRCGKGDAVFSATYINPETGNPWRTEVRGCLIHKQRMKLALQTQRMQLQIAGTENPTSTTHPSPWYRALDTAIAASGGRFRCYRAHYIAPLHVHSMQQQSSYCLVGTGSIVNSGTECCSKNQAENGLQRSPQRVYAGEIQHLMFLHPPNQPLKDSCWGYTLVKSALASGCWPSQQVGQVDIIHKSASSVGKSATCSNPADLATSANQMAAEHAAAGLKSQAACGFGNPSSDPQFMKELADLWALPHRTEPLVVVVCGRNVPPGRMQRCFESLQAQDWQDWGLILIDDCSNDSSCVAYQHALLKYGLPCSWQKKVTHLCWQGSRRGMLFNDVIAIRHVCINSKSVIVTLDADDMLLRHDALSLIMQKHQQGFDFVTVGQLRTDKQYSHTPAATVRFVGTNRQRLLRGGGNVWQHLRSFRKALFDSIPDKMLRMQASPNNNTAAAEATSDQQFTKASEKGLQAAAEHDVPASHGPGSVGYYYELANDWAFTVPMAELAVRPGVLNASCYLYEPSSPRQDKDAREAVIGLIMNQPPLVTASSAQQGQQRRKIIAVVGDSNLDTRVMKPHRVTGDEDKKQLLAEQVGRLLVDHGYMVLTGGLGGVMSAAMKGAKASTSYKPGDTVAILPGDKPAEASIYSDTVICTGLGHYRNGIVGRSDAVIVIGGGAGTLQEMAVAWGAQRPVIVVDGVSGVGSLLAGERIDERGGADRGPVLGVRDAEEAVQVLARCLESAARR